MKKYILILLTSVVTLSSCSDWFDVTSGSEIREKDHYSTLAGFQQSLIGCYISMTDNALYGIELSWYAIEILGHQFFCGFQIVDNHLKCLFSCALRSWDR